MIPVSAGPVKGVYRNSVTSLPIFPTSTLAQMDAMAFGPSVTLYDMLERATITTKVM